MTLNSANQFWSSVQLHVHVCLYLAYEDVGGSVQGLSGSGSHGKLHDKCYFPDDPLHDSHIVQHRDRRAEEDYSR